MTTRPDSLPAIGLGLLIMLGAAAAAGQETSTADGVDQLERYLELHRHEDLLGRLSFPDASLAAFTTDGCSGGLSAGWAHLAVHIERIQELHGRRPPWEECCIAHDRLYHAGPAAGGSSEDSFAARKAADLALQACVLETGQERVPELSAEYEVSTEVVESLYTTIAALMYRAVRVGGVPCSGLPWRWGYGWPECGEGVSW